MWSCCKKQKLCTHEISFHFFYWRVLLSWFFLQKINRQIPHGHQFSSEFLELHNYSRVIDFYSLFCFRQILFSMCCLLIFDESMSSIGGYEPYRSWNTVDITPIWIYNEFTTVPKWWFYFLILTELTSFLSSFVLWSFQVLGKDSMDYGIESGKEPKLGDYQGTPR